MPSILAVFPEHSVPLREARQRTKSYNTEESNRQDASFGRTEGGGFGVGFYETLPWDVYEERLEPYLAGVANRIGAAGRVGAVIEVSHDDDAVLGRAYGVRDDGLERLAEERGTDTAAIAGWLEDRLGTSVPKSKRAFTRSLIDCHGEFYEERERAHQMLQRYAYKRANPEFESINENVYEDAMRREVGGAYLGHDDVVGALVDGDYATALELVADRQPRQPFTYDYEAIDG